MSKLKYLIVKDLNKLPVIASESEAISGDCHVVRQDGLLAMTTLFVVHYKIICKNM